LQNLLTGKTSLGGEVNAAGRGSLQINRPAAARRRRGAPLRQVRVWPGRPHDSDSSRPREFATAHV